MNIGEHGDLYSLSEHHSQLAPFILCLLGSHVTAVVAARCRLRTPWTWPWDLPLLLACGPFSPLIFHHLSHSRRSRGRSNSGVLFQSLIHHCRWWGCEVAPLTSRSARGRLCPPPPEHANFNTSQTPRPPPPSYCIATHPAVSHHWLFEASERWARGKWRDFHCIPAGAPLDTLSAVFLCLCSGSPMHGISADPPQEQTFRCASTPFFFLPSHSRTRDGRWPTETHFRKL